MKSEIGYAKTAIVFCVQDYNNYYEFSNCTTYNTPDVRLDKIVAGVRTQIGSGTNGYSTTTQYYTYKVVKSNSTISVYVDDNLIDSETDTTFNAGYVGLLFTRNSATASAEADNFSMSMTYTDDTVTGLAGKYDGSASDTSSSGDARGHGTKNLTESIGYTSGMVSHIYYEQAPTLDASLCDVGITSDSLGAFYATSSGNHGTLSSGNVYKYELLFPQLVLKDAPYDFVCYTSDASWDVYAVTSTNSVQRTSSSDSTPDYGNTYSPGYDWGTGTLRMWAE